MKKFLPVFFIILLVFSTPFFVYAKTLKKTTTVKTVKPIRILIVPGHDDEVWGAQYGNIKEADMNLVLAKQIYAILKKDKRFEVYITRDSLGYTKTFADYFSSHQKDIKNFKENAKKEMKNNIASGIFVKKDGVPHVGVNESVAMNLYGFNKWAGENKIDAMIHVHFNDYPRNNKWEIGDYKGFAIYVPDSQMPNAKKSLPLAESLFKEIHKKYAISTYEEEKNGIIPDQKLIALGANNTLLENTRSVLIEYGYIYRFANSTMRHKSYKTMSELTANGIKNYFFKK